MATFSQTEIDRLIACEKEIAEAPSRHLKLAGAHWRNDAKLIASDGTKGTFAMFMRRNEDFPENFSVGLVYNANDGQGEITLLRCNGKHGVFNNGIDPTSPHWDNHIHRASEETLNAGLSAEKFAVKTTSYASYEQALQYFVRVVNLNARDANKHFPDEAQTELFEK